MPRQPLREINIEVGRPVLCVARGQAGQRTAKVIHCQDRAFDQDQGAKAGGPTETLSPARNRQGYDAAGEKQPDDRVQKFDANEDCRLLGPGSILSSLELLNRMICDLSARARSSHLGGGILKFLFPDHRYRIADGLAECGRIIVIREAPRGLRHSSSEFFDLFCCTVTSHALWPSSRRGPGAGGNARRSRGARGCC